MMAPSLRKLSLATLLLLAGQGWCAAQERENWQGPEWLNSYPTESGFGSANAGATGQLPNGPASPPGERKPINERGAINSYSDASSFGSANAGEVGALPKAPTLFRDITTKFGQRGVGNSAAAGGASTGFYAGASSGNVMTGGTAGAGSR